SSRARLLLCMSAPPPTEIYTLSLHDALPICLARRQLQTGAESQRQCPELGVGQVGLVDEAGEGPRLRRRGRTGRTCGRGLADAGGAGIAAAHLGHGRILDGIVSAESDEDLPGQIRVQRDSED